MIIRDVTEREKAQKALKEANENLEHKVQERTEELKKMNSKVASIARSAGMAEVASGVLHNVGNVLNSVNVTTSLLREQVRKCKSDKLDKLATLLEENENDLANFLQNNETGKFVIPYIKQLSKQQSIEQKTQIKELNELSDNIDHIKSIITMQQSYTGGGGLIESLKIHTVIEETIKINIASIVKHEIKLTKIIDENLEMRIDKHKMIQVLVNLISNAKHAVEEQIDKEREIIVGIEEQKKNNKILFYVQDNGTGISSSDIKRLFEFGFKKRVGGHGFGLHHSALVANEMGGRLYAESDGPGKGAKFVLEIPAE